MITIKEIPDEVQKSPIEFLEWLREPTIIKTSNDKSDIIITCLVHGMEPSGYYALHRILNNIKKKEIKLNKTVSFIIVNPQASLKKPYFSHRTLDNQSDMNRIWFEKGINEEQNSSVEEIKKYIKKEQPELLVDFHNTTATNPPFAIMPNDNKEALRIASNLVNDVLQIDWLGTLVKFSSIYCNSIVIECGKYNSEESHRIAYEYMKKIILEDLEDKEVSFYNSSMIKIPEYVSFDLSYENTGKDIVLLPSIEEYNFKELKPGTILGWENKKGAINSEFLEVENGIIRTSDKNFKFGMLTTNRGIIKGDVLGYAIVLK